MNDADDPPTGADTTLSGWRFPPVVEDAPWAMAPSTPIMLARAAG
jgi:hypothetical protein